MPLDGISLIVLPHHMALFILGGAICEMLHKNEPLNLYTDLWKKPSIKVTCSKIPPGNKPLNFYTDLWKIPQNQSFEKQPPRNDHLNLYTEVWSTPMEILSGVSCETVPLEICKMPFLHRCGQSHLRVQVYWKKSQQHFVYSLKKLIYNKKSRGLW